MALLASKQRRSPKRTDLTEFGYVLEQMISKYRVRSRTQMAKRISDEGYPVSQPMLSYYMLGDHDVPAKLVMKVLTVLKLTPEDRDNLLEAWWATKPEEERQIVSRLCDLIRHNVPTAADEEDANEYRRQRETRHQGSAEEGEVGDPSRDRRV
jgi:hypothetical protein